MKVNKLIGGALLVAGTCIGAGMLGLPISTAAGGFYNTTLAFLGCWAMMTLTAFLMLEVSLWYQDETNLISMAEDTLGKAGKWIAWLTYLLFLYALMAAYTSGGSALITQALVSYNFNLPVGSSILILIGLFSVLIYLGTVWVDWMNRLLMFCLIAVYISLTGVAMPHVEMTHFASGDFKYLWAAAPLIVTSFGFHLLIPSLKTYLEGDVVKLRACIFFGSLISLCVYMLWEFMVLGMIPAQGEHGLIQMLHQGNTIGSLTDSLRVITQLPKIAVLVGGFSFFAIATSFIGVGLGLFDFLADGFNIRKTHKGRAILALMTFSPPALLSYFYPQGLFLLALSYAGVFASILLILYPALMVWVGRYRQKLVSTSLYTVKGGRFVLLLAILFGLLVIVLQILAQLNLLPLI